MPVTIVGFTVCWCYYVIRGHGMLHVITNPVQGVKEYWEKLVNSNLVKDAKDDRAVRQREAYKKALEKKEREVMAQFAEFEIEETE